MPILAKKKVIFSDEAHFDLGGYVNKQNCRIWGTENPHAYIEKQTHPKRITVWCGFCSRGMKGEVVIVNGDRYRAMFNKFLFTKIKEENIGNFWFQHHATTCHTAEATLDVLRSFFEDHIIIRTNDAIWTPLGYYLWGAVKGKCYANKPETIEALTMTIFLKPLVVLYSCTQSIMCRLLNGQPRQRFEWNYFPLLTVRIVLSNKKKKFEKIFSSLF